MSSRSGPGIVRRARLAPMETLTPTQEHPSSGPRTVTQPGLDEIVRLDPAVAAELDQRLEQAHALGYDRGFAEGHTRATERLDQLSQSIATASQAISELDDRSRREATATLLDLAISIASRVMDRTPHDGGEALVHRIKTELESLQAGPVTIEVHPDDVTTVASALPDEGIVVTADPTIQPGEAHIRGEWAMAEVTREAGWAAIRRIIDDATQQL
ncbi:MAG: hypothetical protein GY708_02775 [Actinomycetia bacterium]|nr:hypothetical protein [Actinomycetes bacterium]MCP4960870.1 hypothetical protein [Actinomycetes bacterium]